MFLNQLTEYFDINLPFFVSNSFDDSLKLEEGKFIWSADADKLTSWDNWNESLYELGNIKYVEADDDFGVSSIPELVSGDDDQ